MDHIASLPIFIDDLYPTLQQPMRVYATPEVIRLMERDVFNWNVYPRFSDLEERLWSSDGIRADSCGPTVSGRPSDGQRRTRNHIVPTVG